MIQGILAKYAMQLLGVLAIVGVITGGYYYIKHKGASEQHETDMMKLADRNAKESAESVRLLEEAAEENARLKEEHVNQYVGILTNATNTTNTIIANHNAELAKLRERQRIAYTKGNNNTKIRESNIPETNSGANGGISEEARLAERYDVAELAELCLVAGGFIRQVAEVK